MDAVDGLEMKDAAFSLLADVIYRVKKANIRIFAEMFKK